MSGSPGNDLAEVGDALRRLNEESLEASVREAWDLVAELDQQRCALLASLTGERLAHNPTLALALLQETLEVTRTLEQRATNARDGLGVAMRNLVQAKRAADTYSTNSAAER